MEPCKVISYSEVKSKHLGRPGCLGARDRQLILEEDGAKNFHARTMDILPSGLIPPHHHEHEHCAFILEGKCIVVCGKEKKTAQEGSAIFIPANATHSWHNTTNTVIRLFLVDIFGV
jgi:quercetin dioxygenase-like cupin family protein